MGAEGVAAPRPDGMVARLGEAWWTRVPAAAGRVSAVLAVVLGDGAWIRRWPEVAAAAPPAALVAGLVLGWSHLDQGALYTTSLGVIGGMILLGTLAAGLGAWLLLGFAVGDLFLASRAAPFRGTSGDSLRTDAALLVCYVVLAMVVTLVPITARKLAAETVQRWGHGHPGATVSLTAIVEGVLVLTWTQAAVVLTRPFFHWHDLPTSDDALTGLRDQGWRLALVGAGAAVIRLLLERAALEGAPAAPGPAPARRRRPLRRAWTAHTIQALLTVVILAGLMDTWADAAAVAAVLVGLNLLRDRAAPWLHPLARVMQRFPTLPRLLGAAVASAVIAIVLVREVGATSVIRPIIVSTIVSLVIVTLVMPEHALHAAGHAARAEPAVPPATDPTAAAAPGAAG
jgi:hypothetical protein